MAHVGNLRVIPLTLVQSDVAGTAIPDRVWGDLHPAHVVFQRNGTNCSDVLLFANLGGGKYQISYTPSGLGTDYLEVYDPASDLKWIDAEAIEATDDVNVVALSENYPTTAALRVPLPNPERYLLYVFPSGRWQQGYQSPWDAIGTTDLNPDGTWRRTLYVTLGTYHLVAVDPDKNVRVIKPFLTLTSGNVTGPV